MRNLGQFERADTAILYDWELSVFLKINGTKLAIGVMYDVHTFVQVASCDRQDMMRRNKKKNSRHQSSNDNRQDCYGGRRYAK